MKQLLIIIAAALSFTSCKINNSYSLRSLEAHDHDVTTIVSSSANWHKGETIEINGHAWQVMFVNN